MWTLRNLAEHAYIFAFIKLKGSESGSARIQCFCPDCQIRILETKVCRKYSPLLSGGEMVRQSYQYDYQNSILERFSYISLYKPIRDGKGVMGELRGEERKG